MMRNSGARERSADRRTRSLHLPMTGLALFALLALGPVPAAWAQPVDCESLVDGGERLKCKHDKVIAEQEKLVGNMKSEYGGTIPDETLDRMEKAHNRSKRHADRMNAKHFKMLTKKQNLVCDTKELPADMGGNGDGDGICRGNERCEEVVGDQIGDDIQPCDRKGRDKEVCVQVCGDGSEDVTTSRFFAVRTETEEDTDPELQADLEESFDDLAGQLSDLNGLLVDNAPAFRALVAEISAARGASDVCKFQADWHSVSIPFLSAAKFLNAIARGIADVGERFCDQTAAGFNSAAVCALMEGVANLANVIVVGYEGVLDGLRATTQDDTGACLEDMSADLSDLETDISSNHGILSTTNTNVQGIYANVVEPTGDLAVIKDGMLQTSGNSVIMVDEIRDHDAALATHDTALSTHDIALSTHDTATQTSMATMATTLAAMGAEQRLAYAIDVESLLVRPEPCTPTLWLPAAQGGQLEIIRDHVAGIVQRARSSGDPTANIATASRHLDAADTLIPAGSYLKACRRLALAVQSLR